MSDPTLIGRGQLGRGLSLFGAVIISWSPIAQYVHHHLPLWVLVGALLANVAWVTFVLLPVLILAGWTMSPGLDAKFPFLLELFSFFARHSLP